MSSAKSTFARLSRPGPHEVLRGDLAVAGIPGVVYTPKEGANLPAIAFAHDWLVGIDHYERTLRHLASWGIVVAAPATERGPLASFVGLADDLRSTLEILAGVRLGTGDISVHPSKLGYAGHGLGAAAAVLAASTPLDVGPKDSPDRTLAGVVAILPKSTRPAVAPYAAKIQAPGLILTSDSGDADSFVADGVAIAQNWGGDVVCRGLDGASAEEFASGGLLARVAGLGKPSRKTQRVIRAQLTGFLLATLAGEDAYDDYRKAGSDLPKVSELDVAAITVRTEDRIAALLA